MIRGLSPIPRGGGKPEGKEGDCITMLGALSLTEGVWVRTTLIRSVLRPNGRLIEVFLDFALNFFEDGITRRSAKLSQAAKPPLESRGALFERRALTKL